MIGYTRARTASPAASMNFLDAVEAANLTWDQLSERPSLRGARWRRWAIAFMTCVAQLWHAWRTHDMSGTLTACVAAGQWRCLTGVTHALPCPAMIGSLWSRCVCPLLLRLSKPFPFTSFVLHACPVAPAPGSWPHLSSPAAPYLLTSAARQPRRRARPWTRP